MSIQESLTLPESEPCLTVLFTLCPVPANEQAEYYYPEPTASAQGHTNASQQLAQAVTTLSKLVQEGELDVSIFTVHFASKPQALHAAIEKRSILRLVGKQTVPEVDAVQPAPPSLLSTRKPCVYKRYIKLPVDQPVKSCIPPVGSDGGYIGRSVDGGGREYEHLRTTPNGTSLHYLAAKIAELLASHPFSSSKTTSMIWLPSSPPPSPPSPRLVSSRPRGNGWRPS